MKEMSNERKFGTDHIISRCRIEDAEEWREWIGKVPSIKFPAEWKIKIIPPYGGAIVRFRVIKGKHEVSVYLDCYDRLGCYGSPYWEIYPYEGDCMRHDMDDVKGLLKSIKKSLADSARDTR